MDYNIHKYFGGTRYTIRHWDLTKKEAQEKARWWRKHKDKARIVKQRGGYAVYVS